MDCLHAIGYLKRAHDSIAMKKLVFSAARSVAAATDAAYMPPFVGRRFEAMCVFDDEEGVTELFYDWG